VPAAQAWKTYDRHHKGAPKNSASLYYHKTIKKSRQYQDNKGEKMNSSILFILLIVILFAIIHEEKLIALEDWIADKIGFIAAKIFIFCKKLKGKVF
jgi:hypothetical protein